MIRFTRTGCGSGNGGISVSTCAPYGVRRWGWANGCCFSCSSPVLPSAMGESSRASWSGWRGTCWPAGSDDRQRHRARSSAHDLELTGRPDRRRIGRPQPPRSQRIEQLLVAGKRRFGGPPLGRKLHRREAGLDRGEQHPDHRHGCVEQHQREKDPPGPTPSVHALAATGRDRGCFGNRAHAPRSFLSPVSART